MKNKHAQVMMMETIAILFIFFVLLIIGFMFYARISQGTALKRIEKINELDSIRVSQVVSFLPDFQCASRNIITDNCFDKYKLEAFKEINDVEDIYYPFFYYSTININEVYPDDSNTWEIYNKPGNGSSSKTFIPISLYDPIDKKYSFGILEVIYYPRA